MSTEKSQKQEFHICLVKPEVLQNLKDLTCSICNDLVWDPLSTPCQHIFCSVCIQNMYEHDSTCPTCQEPINSKEDLKLLSDANHFAWDVLGSLIVYCPKNRKAGCPWRGAYNQAKKHLEGCPLEKTTCSNCTESMVRGFMTEHKKYHCPSRILPCNACQRKIPFKNLSNHKKDECLEQRIACKQCGDMVRRQVMDSHQRICPKTILPCPLPNHRCNVRLYRDQINDHVITAALDIVDELLVSKKKLSAVMQDLNGVKQDLRNKEKELEGSKRSLAATIEQLSTSKRKLMTANHELKQLKHQLREQEKISIIRNDDSSDVGGDVYMDDRSTHIAKKHKSEDRYQSGRLYAIGGDDADGNDTNEVEYFDFAKYKWKKCASLKTARFAASAAVVASTKTIYVFGGYGGDRNLATCERYDCLLGSWSSICPMPTPRHGAAAAILNDQIYIVGGRRAKSWLDCMECYTPRTNSWRTLAPLQIGRAFCGAIAFKGGIYVFGGKINKDDRTNTVERYDVETNSWQMVAPMRKKTSTRSVLVNNHVYCFKGASRYDPIEDEWIKGVSLPVANWGGFSVTCGKNRIFILGGKHKRHMKMGYAYSVLNKRWEALPTMTASRRNPASCWVQY